MNAEPIDNVYGISLSEWIARTPGELPLDAVGLWQIVPNGINRFSLSGVALVDFVRRSIFALLDAGGVPFVAGAGSDYEWVQRPDLGTTLEDIAANVIAEWQKRGNSVDDLIGSIWFALPSLGPKYVKMGR